MSHGDTYIGKPFYNLLNGSASSATERSGFHTLRSHSASVAKRVLIPPMPSDTPLSVCISGFIKPNICLLSSSNWISTGAP